MARIQVLSKHLTELIAAGEVVERPSSVAKELMENAIDAGATSITVEIKRGGLPYFRITDNGCGIAREDIPNAFVSHATSKLKREEDLFAIGTLGFRGEALASIAAVSRVTLLTRPPEAEVGFSYQVEGGQPGEIEEAGCPEGTTIVVRDLFYNTPARMKFLKKDVSEGNAVASVVERIALSHPEISVRFIRDDKQVLLTPGDSKLFSAIYAVLGKSFAESLVELEYSYKEINLSGFICKPQNSRPNRNLQFFFLNGRLVKSATCSAALQEGYKNSIMTGKFPSCVLHLQLPAQLVDVNVHPAKTEVRFERDKDVFDAIYFAAKSALSTQDTTSTFTLPSAPTPPVSVLHPVAEMNAPTPSPKQDFWQRRKAMMPETSEAGISVEDNPLRYQNGRAPLLSSSVNVQEEQMAQIRETEPTVPLDEQSKLHTEQQLLEESEPVQQTFAPVQEEQEISLIGEAFQTYLIAARGEELLFIDKHAAHERMIFNELKRRTDPTPGQLLLQAQHINLTREEYTVILEHLPLLEKIGFELEDFGDGCVLVRQVPAVLQNEDTCDIIIEIADSLLKNSRSIEPEKLDDIYHSVACRAAMKGGDFTSEYEQRDFVKRLLALPDVKYCPHGRPALFVLKRSEIEKQFKRKL